MAEESAPRLVRRPGGSSACTAPAADRRVFEEARRMKKVLFILVAAFVGLVMVLVFNTENERQIRIDQATTPEQLAAALLDGGKSQVTFDNGVLVVGHTLDAVLSASTAVSGFNVNVARMVPVIFARFPQVNSIIFRESGPFHDIRGNESTEEMLRIAFMREDSDRIHWDRISYDNIPKLGENYWMHPGLRRALSSN
ncbi:hypothetical protein QA640_23035 [Bradyrhizobium sp. CB82]|uniref:hypothetical protein n=1 Tax=Bradyrhizobium sp. CB82 TaxID=3039159 RepID=UPI0024B0FB46|nr:hypothetical protein [Bradyrhizobium sp. CB82]WFU37368.1 hypothetical protein QA640_23035 [Bradyrhizobium sp. CB82]